ncbi:MAG TPA: PilZ domain-containing protein [Terriglobales bacterium]|nr:PilZ domain-containing protein [Terriglobales bacterium]
MDDWRNPYQDATSNSVEYLRALKRGGESQPAPTTDSQSGAAAAPERRSAVRYKCQGSAEFRLEGSEVRTWGTVTDISRSGCYVEMSATSPVETPVNMQVDLDGITVRTNGVVRTSHPYVGMGIVFTKMEAAERARLEEILLRLSGGAPAPRDEERAESATAGLLMVTDPASALTAIVDFFTAHRSMSREEFEELIRQSQNSLPRR